MRVRRMRGGDHGAQQPGHLERVQRYERCHHAAFGMHDIQHAHSISITASVLLSW
jgi:hypothetical protein